MRGLLEPGGVSILLLRTVTPPGLRAEDNVHARQVVNIPDCYADDRCVASRFARHLFAGGARGLGGDCLGMCSF